VNNGIYRAKSVIADRRLLDKAIGMKMREGGEKNREIVHRLKGLIRNNAALNSKERPIELVHE
jgi:hypothetical protein